MKLLRTIIPRFSRLLVALFLVAQFAGMVSSPRANAFPMPAANASEVHYHDAQGHGDRGGPGKHHGGNFADTCCALHAYFAGVLPPVIAIATDTVTGEPLSAGADILTLGVPGGRLDRPPRPLH